MKKNTILMEAILKRIEHELDVLTVAKVSKFSGFSYYHFHRLFLSHTGESIKKYILRLRLQRAIQQLKIDKLSITEIAHNAGFECSSSFNKAFKSMFSTSPSDYKSISFQKQKDIKAMKPIRTETITDIKVYSVRNVGPYNTSHKAWETLMSFAYSNKIKHKKNLMGPKAKIFGVSFDDPDVVDSDKLRYDACITQDDQVDTPDQVNKSIIKGGKYIIFLHKGAYEGLTDTYKSIYKYTLENESLRDCPPFEQYLNRDPRRTKPENLRTEIWIPIE
ncbi:MAG: GyrI-like domain-containing protein [Candidatus Cloacimonetes bacterium]|nr:GyrI-like domain-containing protein [Candidatus Cloacimonadota bacterium]